MPLLPLGATARPAVVGAVVALGALSACGAPPSAERVRPITMTEDDGTTRGAGAGARPVELPDPARAGDDDVPASQELAPPPEDPEDPPADHEPDPPAADEDGVGDADDRDDRDDPDKGRDKDRDHPTEDRDDPKDGDDDD